MDILVLLLMVVIVPLMMILTRNLLLRLGYEKRLKQAATWYEKHISKVESLHKGAAYSLLNGAKRMNQVWGFRNKDQTDLISKIQTELRKAQRTEK